MKALITFLLGLGVIGYAIVIAWVVFGIGIAIYGLYLAFSASIILGIIVFVIEPSPWIIGMVMFFMHKNIPQILMDYLNQ